MSLFSVNEQGIITVDNSEVLADVQEAYQKALSSDLVLDTATPQGQLIANDVKYLDFAQEQVVEAINSMNPMTAEGSALDASALIWGYTRKTGTRTVVSLTLNGTARTVVPTGTIFSDGENEYSLLNDVSILVTGYNTGMAECTKDGAVLCKKNTVRTIVTPVSGLSSVNNVTDGIMGYDTENDNNFRKRITANWLNKRGISILGAIVDNIAQIDGVLSVVGRENYTSQTQVIDGITLTGHSIYVCVAGGAGSDIAKVLTEQKTLGAATNGETTVVYNDPIVGFGYSYKIDRPTEVDIYAKVQYSKNEYSPDDLEAQIKNALLNYCRENIIGIGEAYTSANLDNAYINFPFADVLGVQVSLTKGNYSNFVRPKLNQIGILSEGNIVLELV